MSKVRVLIADDEEPARKKMTRHLESFGNVEIVNVSEDGLQALENIVELEPDVAFLDIEMPGLNGIEVAQNLPKSHVTKIVFATAYQEHAIKAFELNSVDYILKPINKQRLSLTMDKILNAMEVKKSNIEGTAAHLQGAGFPFNNKIPIPTADRFKLIDIEDIILVQIEDRMTHIFTTEKRFIVHQTLEQFEKKLPASQFIRINRSTIVNLSHVKEFVLWFGHRFKLIMSNGMEAISSREKSKQLKQMIEL